MLSRPGFVAVQHLVDLNCKILPKPQPNFYWMGIFRWEGVQRRTVLKWMECQVVLVQKYVLLVLTVSSFQPNSKKLFPCSGGTWKLSWSFGAAGIILVPVPSHLLHLTVAVTSPGRAFWRASSTSGDVRLSDPANHERHQHPQFRREDFPVAMYKLGGFVSIGWASDFQMGWNHQLDKWWAFWIGVTLCFVGLVRWQHYNDRFPEGKLAVQSLDTLHCCYDIRWSCWWYFWPPEVVLCFFVVFSFFLTIVSTFF